MQGLRSHRVRLTWPLAMEAALRVGRLDEAASLLALLSETPRGHVPPYLKAQLARNGALLSAARGEHSTVRTDLARAAQTFRDLGYPYWIARTQADLAGWLVQQGIPEEAEPLFHQALVAFTELGAEPDVARLQAVWTSV